MAQAAAAILLAASETVERGKGAKGGLVEHVSYSSYSNTAESEYDVMICKMLMD